MCWLESKFCFSSSAPRLVAKATCDVKETTAPSGCTHLHWSDEETEIAAADPEVTVKPVSRSLNRSMMAGMESRERGGIECEVVDGNSSVEV
jgi:hypothetical protein